MHGTTVYFRVYQCCFQLDAITQAPAQHCQNRNHLANHQSLFASVATTTSSTSDLITPALVVHDLGIQIDTDVSMRSHAVKSACFAVLRQLLGICCSVPRTVFQSLVSYLVLLPLGYCNVVLAGIPLHLARRLQWVMSAAFTFASSKCNHITPLLHQLHWLKVPWRIDYKLAVLVYICLHGLAPSYLANELHHLAESEFRRHLRSLRLVNCLFPVLDSQPTATELLQSPLYESGTVFRSISHLLHHFSSSAVA